MSVALHAYYLNCVFTIYIYIYIYFFYLSNFILNDYFLYLFYLGSSFEIASSADVFHIKKQRWAYTVYPRVSLTFVVIAVVSCSSSLTHLLFHCRSW